MSADSENSVKLTYKGKIKAKLRYFICTLRGVLRNDFLFSSSRLRLTDDELETEPRRGKEKKKEVSFFLYHHHDTHA